MKKLLIVLIFLASVISCASSRYVAVETTQDEPLAVEVLAAKYPEMVEYYNEGVLEITSLRTIPAGDGYDYDVDYRFVRYYYTNPDERIECLRFYYPNM